MGNGLIGLGRLDTAIGRIAFGCEQLGGYQWGNVDPGEVQQAIEAAVSSGVMLFDTADCYGKGESERRLGRMLAPHRDRAFIATKFGVRFTAAGDVFYDASVEWARTALEASLRRLGTEQIDLLQLHYWDGKSSLPALFDWLERAREQGKIRAYGVTNCVPDAIDAGAYPGLASLSLEYSLVCREHERAAQQCSRSGLTFIAYGSLGQGILSGKYRSGGQFGSDDRRSRPAYRNFHGARLQRNSAIVEVVAAQAAALGASPSQVALAWILHRIPRSVALVGIKRREQLQDALGAAQLSLSPEALATLEQASSVAQAVE